METTPLSGILYLEATHGKAGNERNLNDFSKNQPVHWLEKKQSHLRLFFSTRRE